MDRLLVLANREHMPLDKQLHHLLEKFDLTCAMKASPSRSKRLKLLKKTINDVRNEMSLKRVLPSHHHHHHHSSSSTTSSTAVSSSSAPCLPELGKSKEEKMKPNGHFPDDEGAYGCVWLRQRSQREDKLASLILRASHVSQCPELQVRGQELAPSSKCSLTEKHSHMTTAPCVSGTCKHIQLCRLSRLP